MVQLPTEFRAHLESFRGPLDLLLYLVKKDEVDILDIPISRITGQYLAFLEILRSVDPNACGEFLVMAAQLMEIKSKTILPVEVHEEDGEELEDPRLELVLQLLEYKKYKERSLLLEHLMEEQRKKYRRPGQDLGGLLGEDDFQPLNFGNVTVWDLLTAFQKVQLSLSLRQPHRVLFEDRPIEDFVRAILARLERSPGSRILFEELFDLCRDRYDAIGFFLALLEMAKQRRVYFHQDELFGPIEIALCQTPPGEAEEISQGEAGESEVPSPFPEAPQGDAPRQESPPAIT